MILSQFLQSSGESILSPPAGLEETRQIQEYMNHLEICFASDSENAKTAKLNAQVACLKDQYSEPLFFPIIDFYKNIADLKNETLVSVMQKGLSGTRKLIKTLNSLQKACFRYKKFINILEEKINPVDNSQENLDKNIEFCERISVKLINFYKLLQKDMEEYWIYIPYELQEIFDSIAHKILINLVSKDESLDILFNDINQKSSQLANLPQLFKEVLNFQKDFAYNIFNLKSRNKAFPKFEIDKIFGKIHNSVSKDIEILTKKIKALDNVQDIRLIGNIINNFHTIRFEVQVPQAVYDEDLDDNIWEQAERLALRANSYLRNITGEKWYFNVELVTSFSSYSSNERVIIFNHANHSRSSLSS